MKQESKLSLNLRKSLRKRGDFILQAIAMLSLSTLLCSEKPMVGIDTDYMYGYNMYENRTTTMQEYTTTGTVERYINKKKYTKGSITLMKSTMGLEKVCTIPKYKEVKVVGKTDDGWYEIKYKKKIGYVEDYEFCNSAPYVIKDGCSNSFFKSYEPYTAITDTSSPQYKLLNTRSYSGDYGIRMIDGRYCVAVGSYYTTKMGTKLDVKLSSGRVLKCILCDGKSDKDTGSLKKQNPNGSVVEFIVDSNLDHKAQLYGGFHCYFKGDVVSIKIYKED